MIVCDMTGRGIAWYGKLEGRLEVSTQHAHAPTIERSRGEDVGANTTT